MGHPERMGLAHGWSEAAFVAQSRTVTPQRHALRESVHRLRPLPRGGARAGARGGARGAGARDRARARCRVRVPPASAVSMRFAVLAARRRRLRLRADAPDLQWNDVLAKARGQTVYCNAWAGDEKTNAFIAWVGEEIGEALRRQGQHVKLKDTAEAVTRVVAEKAAGRDGGGTRRPDLDQRPELPRDEGAGAAARARHARRCRTTRYVDTERQALEPSSTSRCRSTASSRRGAWRRSSSSYDGRRVTDAAALGAGAARTGRRRNPGPAHASDRAQFPRRDLPQAGALRARARSGGAAEARDRRELRGRDRAAVGLVRRSCARAVARRASSSPRTVRRSASC